MSGSHVVVIIDPLHGLCGYCTKVDFVPKAF